MLANFVHSFASIFLLLGYFNTINLPIFLNCKTLLLLDIYTRLQLSDSWWNLLYPLWTNFYYLYLIIIFTSIVLYLWLKFLEFNKVGLLVQLNITTLVISCLVADYLNLNLSYYQVLFDPVNFNSLLSNNLNKYHPALLFFTFISSFSLIVTTSYSKYWFKNWGRLNILSLILLISITMGSWWAYQEGSWGGWWDWDASEMFSLVILTNLLMHSHSSNNLRLSHFLSGRYYLYYIITLLFYVTLQVSLSVVSHNFGITLQGSFLYINYLLFLGINCSLVLFIFYTRLASTSLITLLKTGFNLGNILDKNYKLVIYYLSLFILYLTFVVTMGAYLQNYMSVLVQLLPNNYYNYLVIYLILIILLIRLPRFNKLLFLSILFLFFNSSIVIGVTLFILGFSGLKMRGKLFYHLFLLFFVLLSLYLNHFFTPLKSSLDSYTLVCTYLSPLGFSKFVSLDGTGVCFAVVQQLNCENSHPFSNFNPLTSNLSSSSFIDIFSYSHWLQLRFSGLSNLQTISISSEAATLPLFILVSLLVSVLWAQFYGTKYVLIKF